jgi:hypothetical protein
MLPWTLLYTPVFKLARHVDQSGNYDFCKKLLPLKKKKELRGKGGMCNKAASPQIGHDHFCHNHVISLCIKEYDDGVTQCL